MKLQEAYKIIEMEPGASPEEVKKQYRKLTKKFHPDINKAPDAEEKFKKINEAYQVIQSGKSSDPDYGSNPFGRQRYHNQVEHIQLSTIISFKESVFGCKKELKFTRTSKCNSCEGHGEMPVNNGCVACGGKGQSVSKNGNSVFIQTCQKCHGQIGRTPCTVCGQNGVIQTEATVTVSIPGGIQNGNILRLSGMGNYAGNFMMFEHNSDVHLHITVTDEPGLTIQGTDVVSFLEISLIEALNGCDKEVNTVNGKKKITIMPMSRHRDEIKIPKLGVDQIGAHKVILDVVYPKDTIKLIEFLKEK